MSLINTHICAVMFLKCNRLCENLHSLHILQNSQRYLQYISGYSIFQWIFNISENSGGIIPLDSRGSKKN